ncbi:MAG: GIY-YIG nuclease family protein [Streptomycetaceae bacterium]|nr:GIY-YIG nuclease family protein [Streptomycetaceae bacterium]
MAVSKRLRRFDPRASSTRIATAEESPCFAPTTALYRFYDAGCRLLYVGVSGNPGERWIVHRRRAPWWNNAVFVSVELLPNMHTALDAERAVIANEQPIFNKRSNAKGGE